MNSARILGIVNVTPDSFSDGGRMGDRAVEHALTLADEGADMLDVGGESTRPGATPVSPDEEMARVLPVISAVRARTDVPLSIDTRNPLVAQAAVAAGASVWNDVSALRHTGQSLPIAAALGVPVVLMHAQGRPADMQETPTYDDVTTDIVAFLGARIAVARAAGVRDVIGDPGIGFGKTLAHNTALLGNLKRFETLGVPMMIGASRKRFIAGLDRDGEASTRLGGSIAAALCARAAGFTWFRVHDVAHTRQALAVWDAVRRESP